MRVTRKGREKLLRYKVCRSGCLYLRQRAAQTVLLAARFQNIHCNGVDLVRRNHGQRAFNVVTFITNRFTAPCFTTDRPNLDTPENTTTRKGKKCWDIGPMKSQGAGASSLAEIILYVSVSSSLRVLVDPESADAGAISRVSLFEEENCTRKHFIASHTGIRQIGRHVGVSSIQTSLHVWD